MKRKDVLAALHREGCLLKREGSEHTIYLCPCGQHHTAIPRHTSITPGTVNNIEKQLACLAKGWISP